MSKREDEIADRIMQMLLSGRQIGSDVATLGAS